MGFLCAFILGFCGFLFLLLQKIAYKCPGVIIYLYSVLSHVFCMSYA